MTFPFYFSFWNLFIILLRIVTGIVFIASGWTFVTNAGRRSEDIEMSLSFTYLLGTAELTAGILMLTGIMIKPASAMLMLIILGAIGFKLLRWKTGFPGTHMRGWYSDLILLVFNLIIFSFGGGRSILL